MKCNADLRIVCSCTHTHTHTHTHIHTHTGRSSMKQFIPQKPVKRGFKARVRANALTGYLCDIDVYMGKPSDGAMTETGLGERVVLQLSECQRGGNYQLFRDNYFTTCHLLNELLTWQLYGCGTTHTNWRGFPETLKQVSLPRGDHLICQHGILVGTDSAPLSANLYLFYYEYQFMKSLIKI